MTLKSRFKASGSNDAWLAAACIAALVIWGAASTARAQQVSANVAVTSDYVFRGVSQTEEEAAVSAGVDLTNGAFYAGAWASSVAFPGDPDTEAEIDLYAGVRPEFAGWTWDFGAVGYFYTGQPDGADYDYVELKAAASRAVGPPRSALQSITRPTSSARPRTRRPMSRPTPPSRPLTNGRSPARSAISSCLRISTTPPGMSARLIRSTTT